MRRRDVRRNDGRESDALSARMPTENQASGDLASSHGILALQARAGNAAVVQMLSRTGEPRGVQVQRVPGSRTDQRRAPVPEERTLMAGTGHSAGGNSGAIYYDRPEGTEPSRAYRAMTTEEFLALRKEWKLPRGDFFQGLSPTREYSRRNYLTATSSATHLVEFFSEQQDHVKHDDREGPNKNEIFGLLRHHGSGWKAEAGVMSTGIGRTGIYSPEAESNSRHNEARKEREKLPDRESPHEAFSRALVTGEIGWRLTAFRWDPDRITPQ